MFLSEDRYDRIPQKSISHIKTVSVLTSVWMRLQIRFKVRDASDSCSGQAPRFPNRRAARPQRRPNRRNGRSVRMPEDSSWSQTTFGS